MAVKSVSTSTPTTEPRELARQLQDGAALAVVDVRTPAEFGSERIAASHNLPLDQLTIHAPALRAATTPLVLVCRSGTRAREAERVLRGAGQDGVQVLAGGLAAWEQAGLPVERGRPRWSMERQVRGVAGGLVLAGALGGLFGWRPLGALSAAIGGGLLFSALTDTCGMARVLARLPYNQDAQTDVPATIAALTAPR
jgi:rhodanese-related sulfurtransferase